jgi:CRISPR-associated protein Cas1
VGVGHKNVEIRTAQYRASFDPQHCLRLAKTFVAAKIQNQRTLLRRNWKQGVAPEELIDGFQHDVRRAQRAADLGELLGSEGQAAARYFGAFSSMLSRGEGESALSFDFQTRNRRPPADPVNALLSYGYALLVRAWTVALTAVGSDAYRGFYHQPRYGRPALSLDMMEPFRFPPAGVGQAAAPAKGRIPRRWQDWVPRRERSQSQMQVPKPQGFFARTGFPGVMPGPH